MGKVTWSGARGSFAVAITVVGLAGCRTDAHQPARGGETSPGATGACGGPPLPPCPLQRWMDANLAPALRDGRLDRLVEPLQGLAAMAPRPFPRWASIAVAGARAAANGDGSAVRDSCGACHDAYRTPYRAEMRAVPIQIDRRGMTP